ncbi:MAG: PAS domain-containing protein [Planctomycetes bacterium]|nr:PAS domain-containing protein [Planctomycetota bacterium]
MYFANIGVLEFDGKNWRHIENSNNSLVRALAVDEKGTVYVGGNGEFGFLAADDTGKLSYVSLTDKLKKEDKEFNDVWTCNATSKGVYFFTTKMIFHWYDDKINVIPFPEQSIGLWGYVVNDKLFASKGDGGIYHFIDGKPELVPDSDKLIEQPAGRIILLPYTDNKILVATEKSGFYIYDPKTGSNNTPTSTAFESHVESTSAIRRFPTEIDDFIQINVLHRGILIDENNYAFSTVKSGIIMMDRKGKLVQVINSNRGLQSNAVLGLLLDYNKNLWAAQNEGISHIDISSPITQFNQLNGLEGAVTSAIRFNERLYVGTFYDGVFYLPDYKMDTVDDKYSFLPVNNSKNQCFDLISNNGLLLGGSSEGVTQIQENSAEPLNGIGILYSFGWTRKFPDHVFLGLYPGFACLKTNASDIDGASIELVDKSIFKEIKDPIARIASDINGDLWLSTSFNGLIHLKFTGPDLYDFEITRYDTDHGLPQRDFNFAYFVNDEIVVATKKGIYKAVRDDSSLDDSSYKFMPEITYGKRFHEDSIAIQNIYADNENKIWISSDNGVYAAIRNQNGSYHLDTAPFKKMMGEIVSFFVEQSGQFWVCSVDGLFRYDSKKEKDYKSQYPALIRKVTIGNDNTIFNGTYFDPSSKRGNHYPVSSVTQPKQLIPELEYKDNTIEFEYTALFYEHESSNQYKYFLDGFDKDWSDWKEDTKKEYTNLPEGEYKFKIKARNIFEHESSQAVYAFTVLPPWYRTIWAYICYVILFLSAFYEGIRLNTRRLIEAKKRLENIVKERTAEVIKQKEEIEEQAEKIMMYNIELEKLSIVASETDNAVIIMDADGAFEWVNDGFERMYKMTLDDLKEKRGRGIVEASSNPKINDVIDKCVEDNISITYETSSKTDEGNKVWAHTTLTPMTDNEGNLLKLIAIDSDITELKAAQNKAITNAHKAGMADVAMNTIHNVGNILNSVKTSVGMMPMALKSLKIGNFTKANTLLRKNMDSLEDFIVHDKKGRRLLEYYLKIEGVMVDESQNIHQQIKKISGKIQSIEDVIDTQKSYAEEADALVEEVNMEEIVEDAVTINSEFITNNHIKIVKEIDGDFNIQSHKMKLIQIMIGLITNAKEAMEDIPDDSRTLKYTLKREESAILLLVTDTGCGIPLENINSIFNHGFTTKLDHKGFGLHKCANDMTEIGGKMWAESDGIGKGATFILKFPNQ